RVGGDLELREQDREEALVHLDRLVARAGREQGHAGRVAAVAVRPAAEAALVPHVHHERAVEARVVAAERDVDQVERRADLLPGRELAPAAKRAGDYLLEPAGRAAG